ncbi:hypothetical protein RUM43_009816 [Polyplax serrata]|uniref:Uncharacterized protein n=1 Tax=Polyplax serrata TaxID=468196 RepID=A0AAN8P6N6_POLSC
MLRSFTKFHSRSIFRVSLRFFGTCNQTSIPEKKVSLLQQLSAEFEDVSYVVPVINESDVRNVAIEEWRKRINILKEYNFTSADCFRIIRWFPPFLKIPEHRLRDCLDHWHVCKVDYSDVQYLLVNQPALLAITSEEMKKRLPFLISKSKSKKTLVHFLKDCPSVMIDDWNIVLLKINYLLQKKRVPQAEIFFSGVMNYSFDVIKARLGVLERCGIYKVKYIQPHKFNKFDKTGHKNPHLKEIFDTDQITFATQIAKITIEEYEGFQEMLQDENSDGEIEDQDESDEEDGYKN